MGQKGIKKLRVGYIKNKEVFLPTTTIRYTIIVVSIGVTNVKESLNSIRLIKLLQLSFFLRRF